MTEEERAEKLAAGAPKMTETELKQINGLYPAYIFRRSKTREIWTTCCGRHETVPRKDLSDRLRAVMEARHQCEIRQTSQYCHMGYITSPPVTKVRETAACPFCGSEVVVKELGRTGKRDNLAANKRAVVLRWYRGALWARA